MTFIINATFVLTVGMEQKFTINIYMVHFVIGVTTDEAAILAHACDIVEEDAGSPSPQLPSVLPFGNRQLASLLLLLARG